MPEAFEFRGQTYARKRELHATLIGSATRLPAAAVRSAAQGLNFAVRPTGRYRHVELGEGRSLIELVHIDDQEEFYCRLELALGRPASIPRMPAHVTLFTEPGGGGIGLYTDAQLEAVSWKAELTGFKSPWRLDGDGAILGS